MFGQNPVRKTETHPLGLLQVQNVFFTTQGEGPYCGQSALFIRLTGCPLRCYWCDTAWNDQDDKYETPQEIFDRAVALSPPTCKLCVITGGEPTRQDLEELITLLGYHFDIIQLETAGIYWQKIFEHPRVRIVCSPKSPLIHPKILANAHAFKYVVRYGELGPDGLPTASTQIKGRRAILAKPRPGAMVYLSPCDEQEEEANRSNLKAVVASAQTYGYVAGVQLHKLFGVD